MKSNTSPPSPYYPNIIFVYLISVLAVNLYVNKYK